ncbi:hypothetical protein [Heliophilum fasciatum]|uniref:Uncharacterized protein n=1 Tax=Heliophilum fasciatum TaxID=35700 RepID=A0A4R2RGF1_9FIRM|nr:hypothetical protein [Heliophilum fasciatum]MCW2278944.1 hypothetical protein [Heliophilum fasciatum]TCP61804.1 hypothetical protein EDD73_12535 [Heliophilum fasciatum]
MCTPETFFTELQLVLKQLRGRCHRLYHDTDDVAVYLQEGRQDWAMADLLREAAQKLQQAEQLVVKAQELAEERRNEVQPRVTATIVAP